MSPKMRENTFARHKDAQALSHTCVQSHTHRYSIPQTLLPALKEKHANSCLVLTSVSQRKIKSDGNSELTFTVGLRAVNSPLFELRLSLRHLHTHTLIHTVTNTQRFVGQVLMAGCGAGSSWWRETCRDNNKNRSEGRRAFRLSCRVREHIQVEQIFLSHFDGAEKEDGFCDDKADHSFFSPI